MRTMMTYVGLTTLLWTVPAASTTCEAPSLQQGMTYAAARVIILKAGFKTPRPPLHGYLMEDQKVVTECNRDLKVCNDYPEIASCSRSWTCLMVFIDAVGNHLRVSTEGEIGTPNFTIGEFEMECKQ